jgi:hypothetical protein
LEANALARPADDVMAREAEVLMLWARSVRLGVELLPTDSDLHAWGVRRAAVLERAARARSGGQPVHLA